MTEFFQSLGMNYEWAWFVATIAGILLIALPLMLSVAMIIYVDRKVWAAINLRRGPNVVGPFGLLQSFADGLKVFLQETIIPSAANKGIFRKPRNMELAALPIPPGGLFTPSGFMIFCIMNAATASYYVPKAISG